MPVPLAPYPTPPVSFTPPLTGAQSQLVCGGCRNLLLYPAGATSVCCAVCNVVTAAPPPGTEMAQLVCAGCHTLLMYIRGATSVQCSCCHTINLALEANHVAHMQCGNCRMLLMYQYGARSVRPRLVLQSKSSTTVKEFDDKTMATPSVKKYLEDIQIMRVCIHVVMYRGLNSFFPIPSIE